MAKSETFKELVLSSEGGNGLPDEILVELCLSENQLASWYACKAIGAKRIEAGIDNLLEVLKHEAQRLDDHETDRRLIAAWSLGKFGYEKVGVRLINEYQSKNELLRMGVVDALGELGDDRAINTLITAIADDTYDVALWASLSAAKLGSSAMPHLRQLLTRDLPQDRMIMIQDTIEKIEGSKYTNA